MALRRATGQSTTLRGSTTSPDTDEVGVQLAGFCKAHLEAWNSADAQKAEGRLSGFCGKEVQDVHQKKV